MKNKEKVAENRKVIIGMSGGVDSSVAAYLLQQQGYDVVGLTMRLCEGFTNSSDAEHVILAKKVAAKLDIEFMSIDYQDEFKDFVVNPFIEAYESGQTPNPCIECNRCIKFDLMMNDSDEGYESDMEHAPLVATGHYAIVEGPEVELDIAGTDGRYKLRKSTNLDKDQSYFLYTLSQDTLSKVIFPLGDMDKAKVREIAEAQGLINAKRKDSQDICFVPDGDYAGFIKGYTSKDYPAGNFVDRDGNILGRHKGIINYTLGQRKGLGLALKKPMYVWKLDMERNEVILGDNEDLFTTELTANRFNWLTMANPGTGNSFRALGRIRYKHKEAPCTVTANEDGTVSVVFDEPQRAITAGQSLVLYDIESDTYVLGGGIITGTGLM